MSETLDFMEVYPWIDKSIYAYYHDSDKTIKPWKDSYGRLTRSVIPTLEVKNKEWFSICFSVNGFEEPRRLKENVTQINAWICEIDDIEKTDQLKIIEFAPVKPSLVIESKNWYHLYRFAENGTPDNWEKICNWLRNFFDGDPWAITIERVLRLPWFYHTKDPSDPYLVSVKDFTGETYDEQFMLTMYSNHESVTEKKQRLRKKEHEVKQEDWDFWDKARKLDSRMMLEKLSGTNWMWHDTLNFTRNTNGTDQICVNWKPTGAWIDSNGLIGSKSWGWPYRINWLLWYWSVDYKKMYSYLVNEFQALKQDRVKKEIEKPTTASVEHSIQPENFLVWYNRGFEIDTTTRIPFTFWNPRLDNSFWRVEYGRFMTTLGESWSWKTTLAFWQLIAIAESYKALFVSLEMTGERVIELRSRKMAWIRIDERNDKNIPIGKLDYMKKMQKQITDIKNLEIVWVNKKSEVIHVDSILSSIKNKYMHVDWITIDNLWFIKWEWRNEREELNYIIRKFKDFCHENNKNINLLHHFNKWSGKREGRTFADVMGTAKLEHDVDLWIFVSRNMDNWEELNDEQRQEVYVKMAKNRDNGVIKKEVMYFKKWEYHDEYQY